MQSQEKKLLSDNSIFHEVIQMWKEHNDTQIMQHNSTVVHGLFIKCYL